MRKVVLQFLRQTCVVGVMASVVLNPGFALAFWSIESPEHNDRYDDYVDISVYGSGDPGEDYRLRAEQLSTIVYEGFDETDPYEGTWDMLLESPTNGWDPGSMTLTVAEHSQSYWLDRHDVTIIIDEIQ